MIVTEFHDIEHTYKELENSCCLLTFIDIVSCIRFTYNRILGQQTTILCNPFSAVTEYTIST